MNHSNRFTVTPLIPLIPPCICFISHRDFSRVIGFTSDKRSETWILLSAICGATVIVAAHTPLAIFYPFCSRRHGRKYEKPVRARPCVRRIITEYPTGDKRILKQGGACAVEGKKGSCGLSLSGQVCPRGAAYINVPSV